MLQLHISFTPLKNETRLINHSKALLESGIVNRVHVLGYKRANDITLNYLENKNITVTQLTLFETILIPTRLVRLLNLIYFQCFGILQTLKLKPKYINIHGVELLAIGALCKYLCGGRLIYDAHELETEKIALTPIERHFAIFLERSFIKFCDLSVVVSNKIRQHYRYKYGDIPIVCVRNTREKTLISSSSKIKRELAIETETPLYIYVGALSTGRNIEFLVNFFSNQRQRCIVFLGEGTLKKDIIACSGFNRSVFYLNSVEPSKVMQRISGADFGIHLGEDRNLSYRYCLPNKFFEYIAAEIPLIVSRLPEMQKIVEEYNIGITVPLDSLKQFEKYLAAIEKQDYKTLKRNIRLAKTALSWENESLVLINSYRGAFESNGE